LDISNFEKIPFTPKTSESTHELL